MIKSSGEVTGTVGRGQWRAKTTCMELRPTHHMSAPLPSRALVDPTRAPYVEDPLLAYHVLHPQASIFGTASLLGTNIGPVAATNATRHARAQDAPAYNPADGCLGDGSYQTAAQTATRLVGVVQHLLPSFLQRVVNLRWVGGAQEMVALASVASFVVMPLLRAHLRKHGLMHVFRQVFDTDMDKRDDCFLASRCEC